jgi:hypothetical protein
VDVGETVGAPPPRAIDFTRTSSRIPHPKLALLILLGFLALGLPACGTATTPCGTFAFTGGPGFRGVSVTVNFTFSPAACGAPAATAETIAYVQIVRIIDRNTGGFLAPNSDQQNRIVTGQTDATQNGWAVDRLAGRIWGYYGRNNDGTFASTLTPGSSTTNAVLQDQPSGWPDNSWFDAVSVPVCIAGGSTCLNKLTGYYYWLFIVQSGGNTAAPFNEVGVDWNRDAFDKSVVEWNNDAGGLSKNSFPAFSRMP